MSKQSGYQQLSSEGPSAQEYGFAARLPQAGESCQAYAGANGEYHGPGQASGTGYEQMAGHMAYPGEAYAGAPVTGYPVRTSTPVAGPVGMGAVDPLGRRERRQARRQGRAAGGHRRRRVTPMTLLVGPVGLLVGLARSALHSSQGQHGQQGQQGQQGQR